MYKPTNSMYRGVFLPISRIGCSMSSLQNQNDDEKPPTAFEKRLAEAKEKLKWRVPYSEQEGQWFSRLRAFAPDKNQNSDLITLFQTPIELDLKKRKENRERKRITDERFMQQFVNERHAILGNDLAAAHFVLYRGGSVKFVNDKIWIKADEYRQFNLPSTYNSNYLVEAIRCDDMELYYEGLANIRRLKQLKFLSFRNVKPFDDWCLDRISGAEFSSLEVLDISGTQVTERGLVALYRIPSLKKLIVDDPYVSTAYELTSSLLQEIIPNLKISKASDDHDL